MHPFWSETYLGMFPMNSWRKPFLCLVRWKGWAEVTVGDGGRPSGKGIAEFSGKPTAQKALDRCNEASILPTTFPRPVTVEPIDQLDDEEGLPEKLVIKNQQFHKEQDSHPDLCNEAPLSMSRPCAGRHSLRWKSSRTKWTSTSKKLVRSWRCR